MIQSLQRETLSIATALYLRVDDAGVLLGHFLAPGQQLLGPQAEFGDDSLHLLVGYFLLKGKGASYWRDECEDRVFSRRP